MNWLGYTANFFIFSGAIAITAAPRWSQRPPIFVLFLIGHVLWLVLSFYREDGPLIWLNGFFVLVDIFAILVRVYHIDVEGWVLSIFNRG